MSTLPPKPGQPQTIRAQVKSSKNNVQQNGASNKGSGNKSIVKAVLANPLTVPWPNLPKHLQATVLANLPGFVPAQVAEYHTSRARCHQAEKRKKRSKIQGEATRSMKETEKEKSGELNGIEVDGDTGVTTTEGPNAVKGKNGGEMNEESTKDKAVHSHPPNTQNPTVRPEKPVILDHLVFGINEVIKNLEWQIDALQLRVMQIGDALADQQKGSVKGTKGKKDKRVLLPTAPPREDDDDDEDGEEDGGGGGEGAIDVEMPNVESEGNPSQATGPTPNLTSNPTLVNTTQTSPLEWIVLPLLSITPINLVAPIPAYCATYNTLVYQHTHISKIARTRLNYKQADEVIGQQMEEVRVVPLGKVEQEMAGIVGLRRVACLGIRADHPEIQILRKLLPKSILHPPRHSLTLPFPTSALMIPSDPIPSVPLNSAQTGTHTEVQKAAQDGSTKRKASEMLLPGVHYAPLHVKGITTTIPADGNAKKQKRMEEVRRKRKEGKERKKADRKAKQ